MVKAVWNVKGAPVISHIISVIVISALAMAAVVLYLLPSLVGWARHLPSIAVIAVINVFLGWTFVGWVLALALALRPVYPAGPVVQVVQNPPPLPPGPVADAGWAGPPGPPPPRGGPAPPLTLPSQQASGQADASHGQ
jgi:hypothetical protein